MENNHIKFDDTEYNFQAETKPSLDKVYVVALDYCREYCYGFCEDDNLELKRDDLVVAKTRYGVDVVRIAGKIQNTSDIKLDELISIKRFANESELCRFQENLDRIDSASKIFVEKVEQNGLKMKLITSHFLVPEQKVIFFFTADNRVDFRNLVKELVAVFKLKIELRQVAARDESKISGGLGQCGRCLCCCCLTNKLPNVSTKMARDQNFSLIAQKSSGPCERLLCCLSFEHDWYFNAKEKFPPKGFRFSVNGETFVVNDINFVLGAVTVTDSQSRNFETDVENFYYENNSWKVNRSYFASLK